jgi:hypothetical protein
LGIYYFSTSELKELIYSRTYRERSHYCKDIRMGDTEDTKLVLETPPGISAHAYQDLTQFSAITPEDKPRMNPARH